MILERNGQAARRRNRQFSFKAPDDLREPVSVSPLVRECVDAGVLDGKCSCYRVDLGGFVVRFFRPAIDAQAGMPPSAEKLNKSFDDLTVLHDPLPVSALPN